MRIHPQKVYLTERRNEVIWELDHEGFSYGEIGSIMNVDKSWVGHIIKRKPKDWYPRWKPKSKIKKGAGD